MGAEAARSDIPHPHFAPVIPGADIQDRGGMIDLAVILPIGLVDADLACGNNIGHHRDMAFANAAGRREHHHGFFRRTGQAGIDVLGARPPEFGVAEHRQARTGAGIFGAEQFLERRFHRRRRQFGDGRAGQRRHVDFRKLGVAGAETVLPGLYHRRGILGFGGGDHGWLGCGGHGSGGFAIMEPRPM